MNILAIDTSGPVAGCAVMAEGKIVHTVSMQHGLTHSETILPEVERAMEASGLKCGDIDVFAAVAHLPACASAFARRREWRTR